MSLPDDKAQRYLIVGTKAEGIEAELRQMGLPIVGVAAFDLGYQIGAVFDVDGKLWSIRVPAEEATTYALAEAFSEWCSAATVRASLQPEPAQ